MKTKFNNFIKEEIYWDKEFEDYDKPVNGIPKSEIIDLFKERELSCDDKENHFNEIQYDEIDNQILISFTSYAFGGEMPKDLSRFMIEISDILGASNWSFVDPMSKVIFYFD